MKKYFTGLVLLFLGLFWINCGDVCEKNEDCKNGQYCNQEKTCVPVVEGLSSEKSWEKTVPDASLTESIAEYQKEPTQEKTTVENKADEVSTCQNIICKPGTSECVGSYIKSCENDATGCGKWLAPVPCKSGFECNGTLCQKLCKASSECGQNESCNQGYCGACQNQCQLGDSKCNGNATETCENINGCLQWKQVTCPSPSICQSGKCVQACQKNSDCGINAICEKSKCISCNTSCTENDVQCDGKDIQVCTIDNGCTRWKTNKTCSTKETCLRGLCVSTCSTHSDCATGQECSNFTCVACQNSCSSASTLCDGQDVKVCKQVNSCWAWEKQSCGANRTCDKGQCVDSCNKDADCSSGSLCKNQICETCQSSCTLNAKKCEQDELYECQSVNGCLQWKKLSCGTKEVCYAGKCEASCASTTDCLGGKTCVQKICLTCASCNQNETRCDNGTRQVCQIQNGCAQWTDSPCGTGTTCSSGTCIATCKQDADCGSSQLCVNQACQACSSQCSSGSKQCSNNQPQDCVYRNGCYVWEGTQTCGSQQTCSSGNCVYTCTQDSDCPTAWKCKNKICESESWVMTFGDKGSENFSNVHVDKQGNIYLLGGYSLSLSLGSTTLQSNSNREDVFVVKMDPQKNVLWAKSFGSSLYDFLSHSIMDSAGNLYITGTYDSTIALGNFVLKTVQSGAKGSFVMKMDSFGNVLWARSFSSGSSSYYASVDTNSLALDSNGNLYVGGRYYYKLNEDSNSTPTLTATNKGTLYDASFLAKLDTTGKTVWIKTIDDSTTSHEKITAIYVAPNNKIFASQSDNKFFHLEADGKEIWNKSMEQGFSEIQVKSNGNMVVVGLVSFYLAEIDSSGTIVWEKKFYSNAANVLYPKMLLVNSKDELFVTGMNKGALQVDHLSLNSKGGVDATVLKFNSSGTVQWLQTVGGTNDDYGDGLALDAHGNLFFSGYYKSSEFFVGANKYPNNGLIDIFLIKMKDNGTLP